MDLQGHVKDVHNGRVSGYGVSKSPPLGLIDMKNVCSNLLLQPTETTTTTDKPQVVVSSGSLCSTRHSRRGGLAKNWRVATFRTNVGYGGG